MDFSKIMATWWVGVCYHKEQLNEILSSSEIKTYSYILHDKCKQENSDELKKPHFHFLIQFHRTQRGSWFKRFATDDMGILFPKPSYDPQAAYDYLIHDTPTARKQKKYLYDPSERISTIDTFETEDKIDENAELYTDLIDLLGERITWHDLIRKKPKRIHMIANIKVAYDMLFFEAFGYRYFEKHNPYPNIKPHRQERPTPPPIPKPPKAENTMQVITDPKILEDLPW